MAETTWFQERAVEELAERHPGRCLRVRREAPLGVLSVTVDVLPERAGDDAPFETRYRCLAGGECYFLAGKRPLEAVPS